MGLFKDFKEDFSQAVNEMMPGADAEQPGENIDNLMVDTLGEEVDVKSELSKLDGLLESVNSGKTAAHSAAPAAGGTAKPQAEIKPSRPMTEGRETMSDTGMETKPAEENKEAAATAAAAAVSPEAVVDETTLITASTTIAGDLSTAGSFDIQGTINGNVVCNGKLSVTGTINGNSQTSEFFADVAKIEGEVVSSGTVKIGAGSVIIGNITAASAVIAGAVKGDIDVQGPVVVDTSAVIMGNIKSRSVQINNGAVIEGFCSQCYADIDVQGLFNAR